MTVTMNREEMMKFCNAMAECMERMSAIWDHQDDAPSERN